MNKMVWSLTWCYRGFYPSAYLSDNARIFAALARKCFTEVNTPAPVVHIGKAEKRKGSISPRISQDQNCDLSRAKINILYLLDHISSSFGVLSENSSPYHFLCSSGGLADPSQKSKVLRNDCRSTVGFILWQKLDETVALACLAQSRSLWSTSSTFSTWKERNLVCNICYCLLTAVLQGIFHAPSPKSIPR